MDAINYLEKQHREVEKLFAGIEKTSTRAKKERKALLDEITDKLKIHTKLEEQIFYPRGRKVDKDLTLEARVEHDVVEDVLKMLAKTEPSDETFMAKITVLKELVEHHVKEEEDEYFPECRKSLGKDTMEELGEEIEALNERLESARKSKRH